MPRRRKSQRGAGDPKYRRSPFAPAAEEPLLARVIPVTKRLSGYGADAGRRDLVAGLTVAALAVPSGMAYAELASFSPVKGRVLSLCRDPFHSMWTMRWASWGDWIEANR